MQKSARKTSPRVLAIAFLIIGLMTLPLAPSIVVGWAFVINWLGKTKLGHGAVCFLALGVAVFALLVRRTDKFKYGLIEVGFGLMGAWYACDAVDPVVSAVAVFGAICVMVRGLDNVAEGLPEAVVRFDEGPHPPVVNAPMVLPVESKLPGPRSPESCDEKALP